MVYGYLYFGFKIENSMQTMIYSNCTIKKNKTQRTKTMEGEAYWGEEYRTK